MSAPSKSAIIHLVALFTMGSLGGSLWSAPPPLIATNTAWIGNKVLPAPSTTLNDSGPRASGSPPPNGMVSDFLGVVVLAFLMFFICFLSFSYGSPMFFLCFLKFSYVFYAFPMVFLCFFYVFLRFLYGSCAFPMLFLCFCCVFLLFS